MLERPVHDLTVFKVHFGNLTLKAYTKGERVLRFEAIPHDSRELRCGRVLEKFPRMVSTLADMLERLLQSLRCIDASWVSAAVLETLHQPGVVSNTRVGGIDINTPRMRACIEATLALAPSPHGFTTADHARKVRGLRPDSASTTRQAAYDLRRLRGKGIIKPVAPRSRRHTPSADGPRTIAGLLVLQDKIIRPLLAGLGLRKRGRKPNNRPRVDARYDAVQREMQQILKATGIAA